MYTRWKKIREEFGIKKEYIKSIQRSPWENEIKYIKIKDEENNKIYITFDIKAKKYRVDINTKDDEYLCTSLLNFNEDPILYIIDDNNKLELY